MVYDFNIHTQIHIYFYKPYVNTYIHMFGMYSEFVNK